MTLKTRRSTIDVVMLIHSWNHSLCIILHCEMLMNPSTFRNQALDPVPVELDPVPLLLLISFY